jgi:hypothetical protein
MARNQIVVYAYSCDVCGNKIVPDVGDDCEVKFWHEGISYDMDLCADHRSEFDEAMLSIDALLERFVKVARKGASTQRHRRPAPTNVGAAGVRRSRAELDEIRLWARRNGHTVADRGRVSSSVIVAFEESKNQGT